MADFKNVDELEKLVAEGGEAEDAKGELIILGQSRNSR